MSPLSSLEVPLSIWHANVNGMGPRTEEVRNASADFAVVVLQDTRLRGTRVNAEFWRRHWPGYTAYFYCHDDDGPGSVVLTHQSFRTGLVLRTSVGRQRLISVKLHCRDGRVLRISSLYASQGLLERSLLDLAADAPAWLLVGDFNARHSELGCQSSNDSGELLNSFIEESGAVVLNDPRVPTFSHCSYSFSDCLDWALCSPSISSRLNCRVGTDIGSDHLPLVLASSSGARGRRVPVAPPVRWRTSRVEPRVWDSFCATLGTKLSSIATPVVGPATPELIDRLAEEVECAVTQSADLTLMRSAPTVHSHRLKFPWWLRSLIEERKHLRLLLSRSSPPDPSIRRSLNYLRRAIREAIPAYHRELAERKAKQFSSGPRGEEFWPSVRQWFRTVTPTLPPLQYGSVTAVTAKERADVLGSHLETALSGHQSPEFDAAFLQETEELVTAHRFTQEDTSPDPAPTSAVTGREVAREISRLYSGRAPGPDGISTDMLKHAPFRLAVVLAELFTLSLEVGYVPKRWKQTYVRMLPKPGKVLTRPVDFRPIALTSCVGKVLERLFARRLLLYCDSHQLLPEEQSAFRKKRGPQEQVVLLAQKALQAMNGGEATAVVALDMAKAYDSVWHAGLKRQCLEAFPGPTAKWIWSFLGGRKAAVLEDGFLSEEFGIRAGVPQGSPLSPLLYIFYTRGMPLLRGEGVGSTVYADDIAFWACRLTPLASWRVLEAGLRSLLRWLNQWRMSLSLEKTHLAFFSRRPNWSNADFGTPGFLGLQLEWRTSVTLLGVTLDRQLSLIPHARAIARKLGPRVLELRRLLQANRSIPRWVGLLLHKCLIRPAVTFAAPVLPLCSATAWETFERVERRGLRAATRSRLSTPLDVLAGRAGRTKPLAREVADQGAAFLQRQLAAGNRRLLGAFVPEFPQRHDLVRWDLPLERLCSFLEPDVRRQLGDWLEERGFRGAPSHPGRPSRGRTRTPDVWGVSPLRR